MRLVKVERQRHSSASHWPCRIRRICASFA